MGTEFNSLWLVNSLGAAITAAYIAKDVYSRMNRSDTSNEKHEWLSPIFMSLRGSLCFLAIYVYHRALPIFAISMLALLGYHQIMKAIDSKKP